MAKPIVLVTRAIPQEALDLLAVHATVDANVADVGYTPEELICTRNRRTQWSRC